jgi:hypothetical protein
VRRGMDVVIDFLFSHLLKLVMAREREGKNSEQAVVYHCLRSEMKIPFSGDCGGSSLAGVTNKASSVKASLCQMRQHGLTLGTRRYMPFVAEMCLGYTTSG